MTVKVIGLDIAKSVFQVHGVNEAGEVVVRRKLRRSDVFAVVRGDRPSNGGRRGLSDR